jgi:hypothetical protein
VRRQIGDGETLSCSSWRLRRLERTRGAIVMLGLTNAFPAISGGHC